MAPNLGAGLNQSELSTYYSCVSGWDTNPKPLSDTWQALRTQSIYMLCLSAPDRQPLDHFSLRSNNARNDPKKK